MGGEKKQRVPRRANRPLLVVVCLLVVLVTAVSGVMYALVVPHLDIASPFVSKPDMTSEEVKSASAATADITEEVESEAVVLLKDDGALPLGADAKVNVFGSTAGNNFSYGGTGSGSGAEEATSPSTRVLRTPAFRSTRGSRASTTRTRRRPSSTRSSVRTSTCTSCRSLPMTRRLLTMPAPTPTPRSWC